MTRRILPALALWLAATPALPQDRMGWADLFAPDRLLAGAINAAVAGLRTQAEVGYDALTVDFASGSAALSGLVVRPLPQTGAPAGCVFTADRVAIAGLTPLPLEGIALQIELTGAELAPACLPVEGQQGVAVMGIHRLALDRVALGLDYTLASGAARLDLLATGAGLATVDATVDLAYLALSEGRWGDPLPVIRFRTAEVTVEDHGWLDRLKPVLSMQMGDLAQLGTGLRMELERGLPQNPAVATFARSVEVELGRFLTAGGQITLAAAAGQPGGVLLDLVAMERDPALLFAALNPVLRAAPVAREGILPAALLKTALSAPDSLSEADRRRAGLALVTGRGAPRDLARGTALLSPLAAGDGEVALALAQGLADTDPAAAYSHALHAAGGGAAGALALLDAVEGRIGTPAMLAAQQAASGGLAEAPYASVGALRSEALALMLGRSKPRDYAGAWYWASLGAAAGDAASAGLRDEIEARIAARGGAADWTAATAPLAAKMAEDWIARDLPARYGVR